MGGAYVTVALMPRARCLAPRHAHYRSERLCPFLFDTARGVISRSIALPVATSATCRSYLACKRSQSSASPPKYRASPNQDRENYLCPRALEVLRAQLALRERMAAAGKISHNRVFFTEGGEPFQTVFLPYNRWREVMETLAVRYRKPYNA